MRAWKETLKTKRFVRMNISNIYAHIYIICLCLYMDSDTIQMDRKWIYKSVVGDSNCSNSWNIPSFQLPNSRRWMNERDAEKRWTLPLLSPLSIHSVSFTSSSSSFHLHPFHPFPLLLDAAQYPFHSIHSIHSSLPFAHPDATHQKVERGRNLRGGGKKCPLELLSSLTLFNSKWFKRRSLWMCHSQTHLFH